jgi:hypothetical protein
MAFYILTLILTIISTSKHLKLFYQIIIYIFLLGLGASSDLYQALNRDSYGRADPNALLNGFFPAWAIILLCLSGLYC